MLVLSRHRDESIMIGDNIVVTIVDIRGDKVRLGIEAPQEVPVHRQEVYEAIQRENRKASQIRPADSRNLGKTNPPADSSAEQYAQRIRNFGTAGIDHTAPDADARMRKHLSDAGQPQLADGVLKGTTKYVEGMIHKQE